MEKFYFSKKNSVGYYKKKGNLIVKGVKKDVNAGLDYFLIFFCLDGMENNSYLKNRSGIT